MCWTVYNQLNNVKRGLFFMDGPEWHETRKKMNSIFHSKKVTNAVHSKKVTNAVLNQILSSSDLETATLDLEPILHQWSVESTFRPSGPG